MEPARERRLVTVGMPVRNGEGTLRHALDAVLAQTHRDLDIVICDNASTDGTGDIVREYAGRDPRIRSIRHDQALTVTGNWASAWQAAKAPYFLWAADDDLRSADYVERLLEALNANPEAGLAFGEVVKFQEYGRHQEEPPYSYFCDTRGVPIWRRLWADKNGPFAPYGLWRTDVLNGYRWYEHTVSPDWPMITYVLVRTEIVQVTGPVLYYKEPPVAVSADVRARTQSYSQVEKYPTLTVSWRSAHAARDASRLTGRRRVLLVDFLLVFAGLLWQNRRRLLRWALKRY